VSTNLANDLCQYWIAVAGQLAWQARSTIAKLIRETPTVYLREVRAQSLLD